MIAYGRLIKMAKPICSTTGMLLGAAVFAAILATFTFTSSEYSPYGAAIPYARESHASSSIRTRGECAEPRKMFALQRQAASTTRPTFPVRFPDGTVKNIPSGADTDSWWQTVFPNWHRDVFSLFHAYLNGSGNSAFETYIGFGEWIGPTAMFAASYVDRVFALEPDPQAAVKLAANVAANPDISPKIHVSGMCIAASAGTLTLRGAGASGSFLEAFVKTNDTISYANTYPDAGHEVVCVPLMAYMKEHRIDPATAFIKVDTEGAEWSIIPSLHKWLSTLEPGKRPTFIISIHRNNPQVIDAAMAQFIQVIHLFRYGGILQPIPPTTNGSPGLHETARIRSAAHLLVEDDIRKCLEVMCDIVLSDVD